jgi:hypothetical protein
MKHLMDKYKGKTFAEAATLIASKYKNRDTDATQKSSYDMEIQELMRMNESVKMKDAAMQNAKQILKCGGKMKYNNGGELNKKNKLSKNEIPHKDAGKPVNQENLFMLPYLGATPPDNIGMQAPLMPQAPLASAYNPTTSVSDSIGNTLRSAMSGPGRINVQPPLKEGESFQILQQPKKPGLLKRMFGPDSNIYNPAMAGQLANLGINVAMLAGGYDKEAPTTNKYESDVKRLMAERSIDNTAVQNRITGAANAARQNLQNVRSANVRNAMEQNIGASQMEQAAGAELQSQQMRNQLTGEYANVLNNLGLQDAQARFAANELTARNKGNYQTNLSAFGAGLAENSKFFTRLKANDKLNQLYTEIINLKAEDVGIGEELWKKITTGGEITANDILVMKNSKNSKIRSYAEFYENQQKGK